MRWWRLSIPVIFLGIVSTMLLLGGCGGQNGENAGANGGSAATAGAANGSSGSGSTSLPGGIAANAVASYGANVHNSLEAGKKTECQSNLQQLRTAIQMHKDSEGSNPASLTDLGSQLSSIEKCPSTGKSYSYDPATGRVWCTTPGHEQL